MPLLRYVLSVPALASKGFGPEARREAKHDLPRALGRDATCLQTRARAKAPHESVLASVRPDAVKQHRDASTAVEDQLQGAWRAVRPYRAASQDSLRQHAISDLQNS